MSITWRRTGLFLALFLVSSCDVLGIGSRLSVSVSPERVTLEVGDTVQVASMVGGASGSIFSRLESRNPGVASIVFPDKIVGTNPGATYAVLQAWNLDGDIGFDSLLVRVERQ